jgi:hypothetical protein
MRQRFYPFSSSRLFVSHVSDEDILPGRPCAPSLLSFCRVSSQWLEPCRRQIYRAIHAEFHPRYSVQLFASSLEHSPHLGAYVRELYIESWGIVFFASLMPNIKVLWMAGVRLLGCLDTQILLLRHVQEVKFASGRFDIAPEAHELASNAWPGLRSLIFGDLEAPCSPPLLSKRDPFSAVCQVARIHRLLVISPCFDPKCTS